MTPVKGSEAAGGGLASAERKRDPVLPALTTPEGRPLLSRPSPAPPAPPAWHHPVPTPGRAGRRVRAGGRPGSRARRWRRALHGAHSSAAQPSERSSPAQVSGWGPRLLRPGAALGARLPGDPPGSLPRKILACLCLARQTRRKSESAESLLV